MFQKDNETPYFPNGTQHEDVTYEVGVLHFIWDKAKSDKCLRERGFDFRTAAMVFNDNDCLFDTDYEHSIEEERLSIIGRPTDAEPRAIIGEVDGVLFVVFTERIFDGKDYIRIISAREADADEKRAYEENRYYGM